ncbi:dynein assembly factor 3, axonemal-like [Patiria miniata]|uniref:Dynein assembly factor 3, axonemal homolog n=1 Tax=Patiria miniata TaxID=46514 RepID=A0A914BT84_PATMI|nr:dynein assembly factor 3, axonemal-like [Patiria miniata]
MTDAFGAITWWGFSPALDLQDKVRDVETSSDLNILMIGAGDCRHMLKTIALSHRHKKKQINFYVIESNLELLGRHLLLTNLALESPKLMGLQEKTELFLEVFGNSLVRQQTRDYIVSKAKDFIRMVTDSDYLAQRLPAFDFSLLKFKERDQLEAIFKFWRGSDDRVFDISKCWDNRLRRYLSTRYDSRVGAYDWDYNMKLLDRGAGIIHKKEYSYWRETGSAFSVREGTYDVPNKTLASGLIVKTTSGNVPQRGYWGDIVSSPYLAFGIESEEASLTKKTNDKYTKSAQDISEHNILAMLHELTTGEKYVLPKPSKDTETKEKKNSEGATLEEITEEEEEEVEDKKEDKSNEQKKKQVEENGNKDQQNKEYENIPIENVKIYFLPIGSAHEIHKKGKYKGLFNMVYLSNGMVHYLTEDLKTVFADQSTIITETARFMLELKTEQCQEFLSKVTGMARAVGCQITSTSDALKDSFLRFRFERKT